MNPTIESSEVSVCGNEEMIKHYFDQKRMVSLQFDKRGGL